MSFLPTQGQKSVPGIESLAVQSLNQIPSRVPNH